MHRHLVRTVLLVALVVGGCTTSPGPLVFDPPELASGTLGTPYEAAIEVSGNVTPAYQFTVTDGALPPGLELRVAGGESDRGIISGTPAAAGEYRFVVTVACYGTNVSGQTGSREYVIRVG